MRGQPGLELNIMRKTIEQIGGQAGQATTGGIPWLSQLEKSISGFKEILQLGKEIKGLEQGGNKAGAIGAAVSPGGQWGAFLKHMIDSGYGDMPIGQILTDLAPYTLKQLISLARKEGSKNAGNPE